METAETLLKSKENLHYCLFFCHLVAEKHLKALVTKVTEQIPPRIHDLEILAGKANLELTTTQLDFLTELNGFVLEARYPDEKLKIYRISTPELATSMFTKTVEMKNWLADKVKS
ncbi:MAG: HEPN domain-containing protein [Ignavibacteriae bacterium]|nr:HEPN domain-containing protein [Ignavibacteriota bacterium]